jgi:hypothetical protein
MTPQSSAPQPSADNPYAASNASADDAAGTASAGRQAYNIVSDLVAGANIRKSDNLLQLRVSLYCALIGAPLGAIGGALLAGSGNRSVGALGGAIALGFAAVVLGVFGSGVYLMIYRAARHLKGRHD